MLPALRVKFKDEVENCAPMVFPDKLEKKEKQEKKRQKRVTDQTTRNTCRDWKVRSSENDPACGQHSRDRCLLSPRHDYNKKLLLPWSAENAVPY